MNRSAYAFRKVNANLYKFTSEGTSNIEKMVEFSYLYRPGVVNLGFGDSLGGKLMDDEVVSNNGDITKVMATVVKIIEDFTSDFPETKVLFSGSTPERTRLYGRILRTYFAEFSLKFKIEAQVGPSGEEVDFVRNNLTSIVPLSLNDIINLKHMKPIEQIKNETTTSAATERSKEKMWYEDERYKDFLPVEKTHFPEKVARANEILARMKWRD